MVCEKRLSSTLRKIPVSSLPVAGHVVEHVASPSKSLHDSILADIKTRSGLETQILASWEFLTRSNHNEGDLLHRNRQPINFTTHMSYMVPEKH